jgi:hypothetical protein
MRCAVCGKPDADGLQMVLRDDYEAIQGTYPPDVIHNPDHADAKDRMCGLMDRLVDPHAQLECKSCRVWAAKERQAEIDYYRQMCPDPDDYHEYARDRADAVLLCGCPFCTAQRGMVQ